MSGQGKQGPVGVFEELAKQVGAAYLSDLASPSFRPILMQVLDKIDYSAYAIEEWKNLLSYILRKETPVSTPEEAKIILIKELRKRPL